MAGALEVWMNGQHVGVWHQSRSGVPTFQYDPQWTRSPEGRALSLSLPITAGNFEHRGDVVFNYFDNLLPDSENIRKRLSMRFRTRSAGAFDLLTAIGRDCVGAVQLMPEGMEPKGWDKIESEPLDEDGVAKVLAAATTASPLGQHQDADTFRISIAGAQEKTALLRYGGLWHRPQGSTPTTHILKLPLGLVGNMRADLTDSVQNEWLCAQILRELGFHVAVTEMAVFGKRRALVVERFDRRWQGIPRGAQNERGFAPPASAWIARLPQEDFCQALGLGSNLRYEADGGPSMLTCLGLLAGSLDADADRTHFALSQLAFWLLAATDGHAKNFSLSHHRGGPFSLTPLYDVISAWPIIGNGPNKLSENDTKLAMALRSKNAHYGLREIHVRHWRDLAQRVGVPAVWERMLRLIQNIPAALDRVNEILPEDFPPAVWESVQAGTRRHAAQFLDETRASGATN
jgi:serine/threonine-protein kinase HipA